MPTILAVIAVVWGLIVTIFYMSLTSRAVNAHEEIATALRDLLRRQSRSDE